MDADGENVTKITDNDAVDLRPTWSPDGTKIAFFSDRDGDFDIFVMDADEENVTKVTDNDADDRYPAWSPDGAKVAFMSDRDGDFNIFVMDADGENVTKITDNDARDSAPAWSPDGAKIAFESLRDGDWNIYLADVSSLGVAPAQPFVPVPATIDTGSPETDRAALIALYNATNGPQWEYTDTNGDRQRVAKWGTDKEPHEWEGVDTEGGRVVKLNLSGFGLRGQLPKAIGNLTKLETLDVSNNDLSGRIPTEIENLTKLTTLDVSNNGLSGRIPVGIKELTELVYLRLAGNSLQGRIPATIGNLNELFILTISENNFEYCVPINLKPDPNVQPDRDTPETWAPISDILFTPLNYCNDEDDPKWVVPDSPTFVKWHIGDTVTDSEERAARLGVLWLHVYAQQNNWPYIGDPIEIYVDTPAPLRSACRKATWRIELFLDIIGCNRLGNGLSGVAGSGVNFNVARDNLEDIGFYRYLDLSDTLIHENIHSSFQYKVVGRQLLLNFVGLPKWITEGIATYFGAHITGVNYPNPSYDYFEIKRAKWVEEAIDLADPWSSSEFELNYHVAPLAIELLGSTNGWDKIPQFFRDLRDITDDYGFYSIPHLVWRDVFERNFGMTVDEFYEKFNKWQKDDKFKTLTRAP